MLITPKKVDDILDHLTYDSLAEVIPDIFKQAIAFSERDKCWLSPDVGYHVDNGDFVADITSIYLTSLIVEDMEEFNLDYATKVSYGQFIEQLEKPCSAFERNRLRRFITGLHSLQRGNLYAMFSYFDYLCPNRNPVINLKDNSVGRIKDHREYAAKLKVYQQKIDSANVL